MSSQQNLGRFDFIAVLKYRTTKEGGRRGPAFSGYRPGIQFSFSNMQTSGDQTFLDREIVYPGETVEAGIIIVSVPYFAGKLIEGMPFEFKEGATIIGTGVIKTILNPILRQACR